jgi:hypothetical protein
MDKPQVNPSWRSAGYNAESFVGLILRVVVTATIRCGELSGVACIA